MILLLDAGNSRFKWAELLNGALSATHYSEYKGKDHAQAVSAALRGLERPERILVSSVLGDRFSSAFIEWTRAHFKIAAEFVIAAKDAYGVRVAYARPERLGADRFAALVAAHRHYPGSCIIVDCGTAVTVDAITAAGEHRGGVILPSLSLMRASLRDNAAGLKVQITQDENAPLFACDTGRAIYSGTLRALAAAIDSIGADMAAQLRAPVTRLLCGGGAETVMPLLRTDYTSTPSLVLQGLAAIAES